MPVSSRHPEFLRIEPKLKLTDAAFTGEVTDYVPRLTGQTAEQHRNYVGRAAFYNVTERTALALIGALVRKPHQLSGLAHDEPLTDDETFGEALQRCYRALLLEGRIGLHVDFDEAANSPKLVVYPSCNIINWTDRFVVIEEHVLEPHPDDPFVQECVSQWRELRLNDEGLYEVRIWRKEGRDEFKVTDQHVPAIRGVALDYIPFWFVTPYDCTPEVVNPPLANLAELNVQHFKVSVDLAHAAHFLALPTPWLAGDLAYPGDPNAVAPRTVNVGGESFIHLAQGSEIGMLETTGNGLPFLQQMQEGLEARMFSFGARMLTSKRGVESAEALRIRAGSEGAVLETMASALESALTRALAVYNQWAGSTSEPRIELNRDFTAQALDPSELKALLEAYSQGVLTLESLLKRLYEGELIGNPDEERAALEQEQARQEEPEARSETPSAAGDNPNLITAE